MIVKTRYRDKIRVEQFAKRYIENNFNGSKTVRELYSPKTQRMQEVMASEIVRKPEVQLAVKEQLDKIGLTDNVLDKELKKIVKQDEMLSPKLSAIVEANKLKNRYPKENVQQQHLHLHGVDSSNIDEKINELKIQIDSLR